jgi:hypothetical protein
MLLSIIIRTNKKSCDCGLHTYIVYIVCSYGIRTTSYCLIQDSPNLEGQVPVFISPRNREQGVVHCLYGPGARFSSCSECYVGRLGFVGFQSQIWLVLVREQPECGSNRREVMVTTLQSILRSCLLRGEKLSGLYIYWNLDFRASAKDNKGTGIYGNRGYRWELEYMFQLNFWRTYEYQVLCKRSSAPEM